MKCHQCGAWSNVLETRAEDAAMRTKRRRVCANGHPFNTYEVVPAMLACARDRQSTVRAAKTAISRFKRNLSIVRALRDGLSASAVARMYALTEARVRQLRQTFSDPTNPDTNGIKEKQQ